MEISGTALLGARDNFYRFDAFVHTSVAYVFGSEILVLYKSLSDVLLLFSLNPNVCRLIRPVCHNKVKIFIMLLNLGKIAILRRAISYVANLLTEGKIFEISIV